MTSTKTTLGIGNISLDDRSIDTEKGLESDLEQEAQNLAKYLTGVSLGLVILSLCLTTLLVGLDNSILATAIPTITTKFNSLDDVGWYGSAFLISVCALQPVSGKIYQYFSLKWTYLTFLFIFELGSVICATAVSSVMLIVGRAVAGMGAAGLFSGALVIIAHSIAPRQRPIFTGIVASMFSVSNIVGPILGGVFTQHVSWRWCFYINLPLGAVVALIIVVFFQPSSRENGAIPFLEKIKLLDLPGLALFIPAVIMLLLALQWGGHAYPWKSATIVGLIVGFGIMIALFASWQWHLKDNASIPFRILTQRSVYSAVATLFFGLGSVQLLAYYMPMWFQVIKDSSPVNSGVRMLPMILGNVLIGVISGGLVTKYGYFNPWIWVGTGLVAISGGVLTTFDTQTTTPMITGIQVLAGMGSAAVIQMPIIALMGILPEVDIPIGTSMAVFFQFFGGAIFLAIGESIFVTRLTSALHTYAPTLNAANVVAAGAAGLKAIVKMEGAGEVGLQGGRLAYNESISSTFYLIATGAAFSFLCGFGIKWGGPMVKTEKLQEE